MTNIVDLFRRKPIKDPPTPEPPPWRTSKVEAWPSPPPLEYFAPKHKQQAAQTEPPDEPVLEPETEPEPVIDMQVWLASLSPERRFRLQRRLKAGWDGREIPMGRAA